MERLNSRVEVGINKDDYATQVAEVKFAVEKFIEVRGNKEKDDFSTSLTTALNGHLAAVSFWKTCGTSNLEYQCASEADPIKSIFNLYPDIRQKTDLSTEDNSFSLNTSSPPEIYTRWSTNGILSEVWKHVSEDTQKAKTELDH
jgi:hypothetical protein